MSGEFEFDWSRRAGRVGPVEPLRPRREGAGRALRSMSDAFGGSIPAEWETLVAMIDEHLTR